MEGQKSSVNFGIWQYLLTNLHPRCRSLDLKSLLFESLNRFRNGFDLPSAPMIVPTGVMCVSRIEIHVSQDSATHVVNEFMLAFVNAWGQAQHRTYLGLLTWEREVSRHFRNQWSRAFKITFSACLSCVEVLTCSLENKKRNLREKTPPGLFVLRPKSTSIAGVSYQGP